MEGFQVIRSLDIHNFRCFRDARLDDVRRFNIFTGVNGSGKTALLESIFIAGGGSAEIYLRTNAWRGQDIVQITPANLLQVFEDFFHQFDSSAGLRIRFTDSSGDQREVSMSVGRPAAVISLPFEKASESVVSHDLKFIWKTPKGTIESKVEIDATGRLRLNQPEDIFPMVFLNQMTLGGSKETADRFSVVSGKNLEKPIEAAVHRVFDQVTGLTVLTSVGLGTIHASVRGVSRKLPIGLVSAGVNKFVAILVAIAWAERGIVLIDEIENGMFYKLFPQMWEEISRFAIDNKTQIFAATHSREFLEAIAPTVDQDAKNYSLLRLEKVNGEARITSFQGRQFAGAIASGFEVR